MVSIYYEMCSKKMEAPFFQGMNNSKHFLFMHGIVLLCFEIFGGIKGHWS